MIDDRLRTLQKDNEVLSRMVEAQQQRLDQRDELLRLMCSLIKDALKSRRTIFTSVRQQLREIVSQTEKYLAIEENANQPPEVGDSQ